MESVNDRLRDERLTLVHSSLLVEARLQPDRCTEVGPGVFPQQALVSHAERNGRSCLPRASALLFYGISSGDRRSLGRASPEDLTFSSAFMAFEYESSCGSSDQSIH